MTTCSRWLARCSPWRLGRGFTLAWWAVAWGCALSAGCAGYQMGTAGLYPPDVKTIYVPMFESDSFRRGLAERLTEQVIKQIEAKTPFKVVSCDAADSILTGRIILETKRIVVESPTDEGREVEVNFVVQVTWTNRRGNLIHRSGELPLAPEITTINQTASLLPEIGQTVATGHDKAIHNLAEQIVSLMENPW